MIIHIWRLVICNIIFILIIFWGFINKFIIRLAIQYLFAWTLFNILVFYIFWNSNFWSSTDSWTFLIFNIIWYYLFELFIYVILKGYIFSFSDIVFFIERLFVGHVVNVISIWNYIPNFLSIVVLFSLHQKLP